MLSALGLCFCFDHNFFFFVVLSFLLFCRCVSLFIFKILWSNEIVGPRRVVFFCVCVRDDGCISWIHIASNRKILIDVLCFTSFLILFLVTFKIYWSIKVKESYIWRQLWCLDEMHKSQNHIYDRSKKWKIGIRRSSKSNENIFFSIAWLRNEMNFYCMELFLVHFSQYAHGYVQYRCKLYKFSHIQIEMEDWRKTS